MEIFFQLLLGWCLMIKGIDKYESLSPQLTYLKDEVLLIQAWKKSHNYIRRHNWYADILELDISTIDLPKKIKEWKEHLNKEQKYDTDPLRVVWAPKSQKWIFPEDTQKSWEPKKRNNEKDTDKEEGNQELRPLAHITIRDQTTATALMLCLANVIETAQGPTEEKDFFKAQNQQIYSYGNRLHCEWETQVNKKKKANFSWGSSKCYRQYYEDYKLFLKRPHNICEYHSSNMHLNNELYVISLDLKKFYDHIDIDFLLGELQNSYEDYIKKFNLTINLKDEKAFWSKAKEILSWKWSGDEKNLYDEAASPLPLGLPQGLVASGFFANAYLIDFDRLVGNMINDYFYNENIKVLDYCRYVDDIRLVVETSKRISIEDIKIQTEEFIQSLLNQHLQGRKEDIKISKKKIELNKDKTEVTPFHQMSSESNISAIMNSLQGRLSGVPDSESLDQIVGELINLLKISDIAKEKNEEKGNALKLSRLLLPHIDIRDDTLKRFSASRLIKSLRLKRSMSVHQEMVAESSISDRKITNEQLLDHEFETVARILIFSWAKNPSLSLLLKYGLDLYPSEELLYPVLEALESKLFDGNVTIDQRKTAEYIASDLLRAASLSIGYKPDSTYPTEIDLTAFREELGVFAKKVLEVKYQFPWYVKQQAILFLITIEDLGFDIDTTDKHLNQYRSLQEALLYKNVEIENPLNTIALSIIAQQLKPNKQKFAKWFINWIEKLDEESTIRILKLMIIEHPMLLKETITSERTSDLEWKNKIPSNLKLLLTNNDQVNLNKSDVKPISLLKIIRSANNPFKQENALLLLAKNLMDKDSLINMNKGLGIEHISVSSSNWDEIQNPHISNLSITWESVSNKDKFNLFENPTWIAKNSIWTYVLGTILRSCITSEFDFTTNRFLYTDEAGSYSGIKSTSATRAFSLINQGKGLSDEFLPITPWFNELLYKLLQWPGVKQWTEELKGWDNPSDITSLVGILEKRIQYQKEIYGKLSNTPTYVLPIKKRTKNSSSNLKFAIVQPLLPQTDDFNDKNPLDWNLSYRKKHRDHLASICEIILRQIRSTVNAKKKDTDSKYKDLSDGVDVIVFPELSIHPDDIDILRGLSDKTKAHIFAGMTFIEHKETKKPINQAMWLLRSEHSSGRDFIEVYQGKHHMTKSEDKMNITSHRPFQIIVELEGYGEETIKLTGAICYDATDLKIAADLRDVSDIFIISALNKDIQTFDNMIAYLHYHMYQPVILANTGQFGGSSVQAPFSKNQRTITHMHGNQQLGISIFELDPSIFKETSKPKKVPDIKTPPAGYKGR